MNAILERIVAAVTGRLDQAPAAADLETRAIAAVAGREARSLRVSLEEPGIRVIAEAKRRSPSAGLLRDPFDPVALARAYSEAGAAAISVVTEPDFFAGDPAWLEPVRASVTVPILRKDFIVDPRQLYESVLWGADAVLLIAAILPQERLTSLTRLASELNLDVLLEVHDEAEFERALQVDAPIVGVNARNLQSFAVDVEAAAILAERLPPDRVAVVESGIGSGRQVRALAERGLRRFLVGEHLVRADDPKSALRELLGGV